MKKIELSDNKVELYYTIKPNKDNNELFEFLIKTRKKCKLFYDDQKEPVITDTILKTSIDKKEIDTIKNIMQSRKNALTYIGNESLIYKEIAQLRASSEIEIPYVES